MLIFLSTHLIAPADLYYRGDVCGTGSDPNAVVPKGPSDFTTISHLQVLRLDVLAGRVRPSRRSRLGATLQIYTIGDSGANQRNPKMGRRP